MLLRATQFVLYALVFALPLAMNPWGYSVHDMPKQVLFKLGVCAMVLLFVLRYLWNGKLEVRWPKHATKFLVAFVFVALLGWVNSIHPHLSFYGDYFRQEGLLSWAFYLVLFFLGYNLLITEKDWARVLNVLAVSGFFVGLYAIFQSFGVDFLPAQAAERFAGRSFSTLGSPTMLGSFLIFPLFATFIVWKQGSRSLWKHVLLLLFAGVILWALYLSLNRASMLALLVAAVLQLFYYYRHSKKHWLGFSILGLVSVLLFVLYFGDDLRSLFSRFSLWRSALNMIADHPVLGYGWESFSNLFNHYVQSDFFQYEDYYATADRPHNEFLQWWVHVGIVGALFYIAVVGAVLKAFWCSKNERMHFCALALLTFFVSIFFSFSLVTQYAFVVLFLVAVFGESSQKRTYAFSWKGLIFCIVVSALLAVSALFCVHLFKLDLELQRVYSSPRIYADALLEQGSVFAAPYHELYNVFLLEGDYETAALANEKALQHSGGSLKALLNGVRLYRLNEDYEAAEQLLVQMYDAGHRHPLFLEQWADFYFEQQDYESAAFVYEAYFSMMPDHWQDEGDRGRRFWKDHPRFEQVLEQAIEAYEKTGRFQQAEVIRSFLETESF